MRRYAVEDLERRLGAWDVETTPERTPYDGVMGLYEVNDVLRHPQVTVFHTLQNDNGTVYQIRCPWQSEHGVQKEGRDGTIFTAWKDGGVSFHCPHDHCKNRHWAEFRDHLNIHPKVGAGRPRLLSGLCGLRGL